MIIEFARPISCLVGFTFTTYLLSSVRRDFFLRFSGSDKFSLIDRGDIEADRFVGEPGWPSMVSILNLEI